MSYDEVLSEAMHLTPAERLKLAGELVRAMTTDKNRSIVDFFGVAGPSLENAQDRVDRLRAEWEARDL